MPSNIPKTHNSKISEEDVPGVPNGNGDRRTILSSIPLPYVMWLLVTVVSIASFIFTYGTRISVIEQKQLQIPENKENIEELQSEQNEIILKQESQSHRINTLEDEINSLQKQINSVNDEDDNKQ